MAASHSATELNISTRVTWQDHPGPAAGPSRVGASLTARGYKQAQMWEPGAEKAPYPGFCSGPGLPATHCVLLLK